MRRSPIALGALVLTCVASGCGGGSGSPSSVGTPIGVTTSAPPQPAGPTPSTSARMICNKEARADVDEGVGIPMLRVSAPTWVDHKYSCDYEYADATISMSVKELDSERETLAYYRNLGRLLGRRPDTLAIGREAFLTENGSVVVRKDWKVLLVDVSHVPAQFGVPPFDPSDIGLTVAATIMLCWTGA